jgi:hypothetical protein
MTIQKFALAAFALALVPALASAQQPTRRRQAPIEIRGQVPTPQVVTVRPRAMPAYSRQVLVPRFFDHDFWPEIQLGYQMVPERQISGRAVADSLTRAPDGPRVPATRTPPATPPDTTTRPPGTAPAREQRTP